MSSVLPGPGDDGPVDIFTGRPIRDHRPGGLRRNSLWQRIVRHPRWTLLLVAALGAGAAVGVVRHESTTPVAVASTVTGTSGNAPAVAVVPHDASMASLPWGTVGAGWTALVWQTVQDIDTGYERRGIYLVSPTGVRYRVGDVLGGTILDVSPDGRRILVSAGTQPAAAVVEFDVATGTSHTITLAQTFVAPGAGTSIARYTRPSADALLVGYSGTGIAGVVVERRGLDGILQQRFPPISDALTSDPNVVLPTPDGHGLLLSTTTGMSLLDTRVGALVRRFPLPLGTASCSPQGWWAPGVARVRCDASGGSGLPGSPSVVGPVSDVWAFPIDGSPARRLTTADGSMAVGYVDAWSTAIGTVAKEGTRASDACPASALEIVAPDGARTPVYIGVPDPAPITPLAFHDRTAYVLVGACGGRSTLVADDLVSATAHPLTGAGVDGGTIVSAVTIGRDD
ncbi:MAG: hypothetical protein ABI083_04750 [Lapillicoccus sp.]